MSIDDREITQIQKEASIIGLIFAIIMAIGIIILGGN